MRLLALLAFATTAHAAILTYYLHDARIAGGEATGAFAFDTDTQRLVLPDLAAANTDAWTKPISIPALGLVFFPALGGGDPSLLIAGDAPALASIHLAFTVPLGGSVAPFDVADSYVKFGPGGAQVYFASGFASTTPVPEPQTWAVALAGMAMLWRRR